MHHPLHHASSRLIRFRASYIYVYIYIFFPFSLLSFLFSSSPLFFFSLSFFLSLSTFSTFFLAGFFNRPTLAGTRTSLNVPPSVSREQNLDDKGVSRTFYDTRSRPCMMESTRMILFFPLLLLLLLFPPLGYFVAPASDTNLNYDAWAARLVNPPYL